MPRKDQASRHVKAHGGSYLKVAAAVGALATAINGYVDLQKNQEALLQTIAVRINSLTAKVSYLEGQLGRRVGPPRPITDDGAYRKVPKNFKELRKSLQGPQEGK